MPRRPAPRLTVRILDENRSRSTKLKNALDPRLFDVYTIGSFKKLAQQLDSTDIILVFDKPGDIEAVDRAMMEAMKFVPFCAYGKPNDPWKVVSAMRRGAIDYFLFPTDVTLNERVLFAYSEGKPRSLRRLQFEKTRVAIGSLTKRQYEIVVLTLEGLNSRMIARQLGIAQRTAEIHLNSAMRTLQLETQQQLNELAWALQHSHVEGVSSKFKHSSAFAYEPTA